MRIHYVLVLGGTLLLSACMGNDQIVFENNASRETGPVIVSRSDAIHQDDLVVLEQPARMVDVPSFSVPTQRDLRVMTSKLSGGGVELYDLEAAPRPIQTIQAPAQVSPQAYAHNRGRPFTGDSSVTLFSIEGYDNYPGQLGFYHDAIASGPHVQPSFTPGRQPKPLHYIEVSGSGVYGQGYSKAVNTQVFFDHGSAELDVEDRKALKNFALQYKKMGGDIIHIEGYASKRAPKDAPKTASVINLEESMKRTSAVTQELIAHGIPSHVIRASAYGDTKIVDRDDEDLARRVDIFTSSGQ